jgi:hypothetical protein
MYLVQLLIIKYSETIIQVLMDIKFLISKIKIKFPFITTVTNKTFKSMDLLNEILFAVSKYCSTYYDRE